MKANWPLSLKGSGAVLIKWLLLFVLLLNASVVGLAGLSLYRNKVHEEEQACVNARNLARVLEQNLVAVISKMDVGLLGVVSEAQRQYAKGDIDVGSMDAYSKMLRQNLPEMDGVRITNARGEYICGTGLTQAKRISIADRDYFTHLRYEPRSGVLISNPLVSRVTGKWIVLLSRRVNRPDGSFAGVANAAINLEQLKRIFGAVDIGSKGSITLRDDQLGLVLRYPELPQGPSIRSVSNQFQELVQAGRTEGTYQTSLLLDGLERTHCYRKISGLPFYIDAGLATDDYLQGWRSELFQVSVFVAIFGGVTLVASLLIYREARRKHAAVANLVQQEAKYHTVADHTYAWEFWLDPNGAFIYTSPSCHRVSGYPAEAFYSDPGLMLKIVLPEDQKLYLQHCEKGPSCNTVDLAFRIRHADGSLRWLEHVCQQVFDQAGTFCGVRGSNRDITERKEMEEALRVSEHHFHQLFMQNWEPVVLLRQENLCVIDANPAMLALFGYHLQELQQLKLWFIASTDTVDHFHCFLEDAARKGEAFLARAVGVCKNQNRIIISAKAKVIRLRQEDVIYCSLRDITERIRLEEESRETQSRLIHTNKMASLGMLVSGIAHEINNPNQYLSMNAQILDGIWKESSVILSRHREMHGEFMLRGLSFDQVMETVPRLLSGLSDGSRRIGIIVNNLKDYARSDSATHQSHFDLNQSARDAVQILNYQIHRQTNNFSCDLAGDLPQVRGKAQQIEQVIINLITNALDALLHKGQSVRVESYHDTATDSVVLTVSDQGAGMEKELLERITEPFFSTKLEKGGTGLGLSISATIIKEHGGTLQFASSPGAGTTAAIRLKAATLPGCDTEATQWVDKELWNR